MQAILLSALYDRKAVVLCASTASFTQLGLGDKRTRVRDQLRRPALPRARLVRRAEGMQLRVRRSRGHQA